MIRTAALFLATLLAIGCQQQPSVLEHHETIAGIPHSLWIASHDQSQARRASNAVFTELRLLSEFTHPVNSKPISRVNVLLRSGEWFSVNPSMTGILSQSADYYRATGGIYNPPGIGALRELLGWYRPVGGQFRPDKQLLGAVLSQLPTMEQIELDGIRMRGTNKRIRLDFDWFAHGYAIDMQIDHLRQLGIDNARLRIQGIEKTVGRIPGMTDVNETAACRRELVPGKHAVIDPATGTPQDRVRSVEVTAARASDASVACLVMFLSDTRSWKRLATDLNLAEARIITSDGMVIRVPEK